MNFFPAAGNGGRQPIFGGGLEVNPGSGAVIYVEPGSSAATRGLRKGDVIQSIDGYPYAYPGQLLTTQRGQSRKLVVYRSSTNTTLEISLALYMPLRTRLPEVKMFSKIAYVEIPGFNGDGYDSTSYATMLQGKISELDEKNPCGWILDLRNNDGGLFYAMLLGLAPLLGDGVIGGLEAPNFRGNWVLRPNRIQLASEDGSQEIINIATGYRLRNSSSPVALLIGQHTISAGEAVAIAFKGRPMVRFFGEPTFGFTTALKHFRLSDGATLVISTAFFRDREGKVYDQQIEPDDFIPTEWGFYQSEKDTAIQRAIQWLESQTACRNSSRP